jgi:hypothetical protein
MEGGMDVNIPFTSLLLIRAEFLEIPRLQLTQTQVEHLWGIDTATASMLLRMLVDTRFLQRVNGNAYVRANADATRASHETHEMSRVTG